MSHALSTRLSEELLHVRPLDLLFLDTLGVEVLGLHDLAAVLIKDLVTLLEPDLTGLLADDVARVGHRLTRLRIRLTSQEAH